MIEIRIHVSLRGVLVNFDPFVRAYHGAEIETPSLSVAIEYAVS